MSYRVRRGLALLVVAVAAALVAVLAMQFDSSGGDMLRGLAGATAVIAGLWGVGLLILGLLRD